MDNRELADELAQFADLLVVERPRTAQRMREISAALRAAPAEREPVAWMYDDNTHLGPVLRLQRMTDFSVPWTETPLYADTPAAGAGQGSAVPQSEDLTPTLAHHQGSEQEGSEATRSQSVGSSAQEIVADCPPVSARPDAGTSEDSQAWAGCHIHGKFYSGYAACPTCAAEKAAIAEGKPDAGASEGKPKIIGPWRVDAGSKEWPLMECDECPQGKCSDCPRLPPRWYPDDMLAGTPIRKGSPADHQWQSGYASGWADAREAAIATCTRIESRPEEPETHEPIDDNYAVGWVDAASDCSVHIRDLSPPSAGGGK